jgi:hypothetical protein
MFYPKKNKLTVKEIIVSIIIIAFFVIIYSALSSAYGFWGDILMVFLVLFIIFIIYK